MTKTCVILVTAPTQETAVLIAQGLVEERLAACANILPGVRSIYHWDGAIQDEAEVYLLIKTRLDLVEKQVIPFIRAHHPYQEPEIIALPIEAGSTSYLDWILRETEPQPGHS